jgi:phosphate transport system substrate-binding protein
MRWFGCGTAVFAVLLFSQAFAQDLTLTSRDGSLSLTGTLQGYDGEFFRIMTNYGPLTVDGEGVICDGPACPDLTAPKAMIRFVGAADAGQSLLPQLFAAFAKSRGLDYAPAQNGGPAVITDPVSAAELAEFAFDAMPPDQARAAMLSGAAQMMLASAIEPDLGAQAVALDALVPIMSPGNPTPRISTTDLARVLSGEVQNWNQVGGPDMPLVLHALSEENDLQKALAARLGRDVKASVTHESLAELAAAVARDPWAIAVTERAALGAARLLPLTDSCGFPLQPTRLAVKAQDYPLTLPIYFLTPRHRLPLVAREFLEFLSSPEAQRAIALAGYIDRRAERQPMTTDGLRLINAIKGAGPETTLDDLQNLAKAMDGADRLSLTFRFEGGTTTLDAASQSSLVDLAQMLEAGLFKGQDLTFAGFSDGSGPAKANLKLAEDRAQAVLGALQQLVPGFPEEQLPKVRAFGEALPMACDETGAGRRLNRRVELWTKPAFGAAKQETP